jgi:hypothetical protein
LKELRLEVERCDEFCEEGCGGCEMDDNRFKVQSKNLGKDEAHCKESAAQHEESEESEAQSEAQSEESEARRKDRKAPVQFRPWYADRYGDQYEVQFDSDIESDAGSVQNKGFRAHKVRFKDQFEVQFDSDSDCTQPFSDSDE